jgi:uncharacterized protein YecE (DUF72 family)
VIRVGTAGWSYADWQGRVYPTRRPPGFHPLAYLARYLDCIELNSSFYALPDPRHAARWVELVDAKPEFRFTAKLLQSFTHDTWPEDAAARAAEFRSAIGPLARSGKWLALLVQFPHSLRPTEGSRVRLQRILEHFGELRPVLELRHASWFEPDARPFLAGLGCPVAHVDMPEGADQAPRDFEPLPGPGYLRLHGRNRESWFDRKAGRDQRYDYLYGRDEVREIVERVRRLAAGRDETVVVTNNHFAGQAVANALEIESGLTGAPVLAPDSLVAAFPRLRETTRSDGQGTLF